MLAGICAAYCSHMKRTQIYIREDQAKRIEERAEERGVSQAEVIRQILDAALDTGDAEAEARAGTTVEIHDAPLMTLNVEHFPMFEGLKPAFGTKDDRADRI
jgi:hypothetical protein